MTENVAETCIQYADVHGNNPDVVVINFSHPFTQEVKDDLTKRIGDYKLYNHMVQVDLSKPMREQIYDIFLKNGFDDIIEYADRLYIHLPGHSVVAVEVWERVRTACFLNFPQIIRLNHVGIPPKWEIVEIM